MCDAPMHVLADGVTVIVAITAAVVVSAAVKDGITPEPAAGKPMVVSELVQLKAVSGTDPMKLTGAVDCALHSTWLSGLITSGVGSIVYM